MKQIYPKIVMAALVVTGLQLSACSDSKPGHVMVHPVKVESIDGTDLHQVTLTEQAMERLNVKTSKVMEDARALGPGSAIFAATKKGSAADLPKVVPYASLMYGKHGETFVYVSPKPRTFVRHPVVVYDIKGDKAILSEGPPSGSVVAMEGVAEIYGSEFEVGH